MPATLKLNVKTITDLIEQLTPIEQEELIEYLQKLDVKKRLQKFRERKQNIPLSLDEITAEVEKVRAERQCSK